MNGDRVRIQPCLDNLNVEVSPNISRTCRFTGKGEPKSFFGAALSSDQLYERDK
jgi:hypothetical protein